MAGKDRRVVQAPARKSGKLQKRLAKQRPWGEGTLCCERIAYSGFRKKTTEGFSVPAI